MFTEKVAIHYYGRLAAKQGWRFDSTYDHKDATGEPIPFEFILGSGKVSHQKIVKRNLLMTFVFSAIPARCEITDRCIDPLPFILEIASYHSRFLANSPNHFTTLCPSFSMNIENVIFNHFHRDICLSISCILQANEQPVDSHGACYIMIWTTFDGNGVCVL
mgnify:CR=1 FL=1